MGRIKDKLREGIGHPQVKRTAILGTLSAITHKNPKVLGYAAMRPMASNTIMKAMDRMQDEDTIKYAELHLDSPKIQPPKIPTNAFKPVNIERLVNPKDLNKKIREGINLTMDKNRLKLDMKSPKYQSGFGGGQ